MCRIWSDNCLHTMCLSSFPDPVHEEYIVFHLVTVSSYCPESERFNFHSFIHSAQSFYIHHDIHPGRL